MTMTSEVGLKAEEFFLCAAVHAGFKMTNQAHPFTPGTIRKTARFSAEDRNEIDFVLTLPRTKENKQLVIPLQLTVIRSRPEKEKAKLIRKRRNHKEGRIALFWPIPELGQERTMELLEKAADGVPHAVEQFKKLLDDTCEEFLAYKACLVSCLRERLDELAENAKEAWKVLDRFLQWLPKALRKKIGAICCDPRKSKEERIQKVRNVLTQAIAL